MPTMSIRTPSARRIFPQWKGLLSTFLTVPSRHQSLPFGTLLAATRDCVMPQQSSVIGPNWTGNPRVKVAHAPVGRLQANGPFATDPVALIVEVQVQVVVRALGRQERKGSQHSALPRQSHSQADDTPAKHGCTVAPLFRGLGVGRRRCA